MSIVPNDQIKDAANLAEQEAAAAGKAAPVPDVPVPPPPTFSPHINHAAVTVREAAIRIDAYDLGILTLESELRGSEEAASASITKIEADTDEKVERIQREARAKVDELKADASYQISKIRNAQTETRTSLARRIDDLGLAKDMMLAQVAVHAKRYPPQTEETSDAETDTELDPAGTGEAGGTDGDTQEPGAGGDA